MDMSSHVAGQMCGNWNASGQDSPRASCSGNHNKTVACPTANESLKDKCIEVDMH